MQGGVDARRILLEDRARTTLESVLFCTQILRRRGTGGTILVCTDSYHQRRCAFLFRMQGFTTETPAMPSGLRANGPLRWAWYHVRECIALPRDVIRLLLRGAA